jgi:hypothetical protein
VTKFFEDALARKLQPATISKQKNPLNKRLLPWCEKKGFRLLKQLDVDALREFRAGSTPRGQPVNPTRRSQPSADARSAS